MYAAVSASTFPDTTSSDELLRAAAAAGFGSVELVVSSEELLRPDTPTSEFARLGTRAAELGLRLAGLTTELFRQFNYGSEETSAHQRACDLTLTLLDQAVAAGAGAVMVVPAIVGPVDSPRRLVTYADAWQRTLAALSELRFEAESRGVTLAIENAGSRFLLSPLEAVELIDEINSPNVGLCLDTGRLMDAGGYPEDWIATLGGRIARVRATDCGPLQPPAESTCRLDAGSVDWPATARALRAVGYDGPLTCAGGDDPADMCRWLTEILTERPPLGDDAD